MADVEAGPARGSMVTFLLRDERGERFRVGEAIGPLEADPMTGEKWLGVRMSESRLRQTMTMIPLAAVLNVTPPRGVERDAA